MKVRRGEIPLPEVLTRAQELEQQIRTLTEGNGLPPTADHPRIEAWMTGVYLDAWTAERQ